jgi:carbon-monoxide dehydrogenase medium subunit
MPLPEFEYHEPHTLPDACRILGELREKARPLAGGTDLIVGMRKGNLSPEHLVSLGRIDSLADMARADGFFKIGACVTVARIARSETLGRLFGALNQGACNLGSPLVRNLATIGGNLVSARPAADLPPALLAYGASVMLVKSSGERKVPLDSFFSGPGSTVMEPDEILTEIILPEPPPRSGAAYVKLGRRRALEISVVNVASFIELDGTDGTIRSARVVLGAVAPTPIRATSAERVLKGEKPADSLFQKAGLAAADDSSPISDHRGSAEYRREMAGVLCERSLRMALERAR